MKSELTEAMKNAMREKDKIALTTIRSLLSAIQYEEMQKNEDSLNEADILSVLKRELKKRSEELEFAEKSGRTELIEDLKREAEVIQNFLPKQLEEVELRALISGYKQENPDIQLGQVMKQLGETHSGQYDGKIASKLAREILG